MVFSEIAGVEDRRDSLLEVVDPQIAGVEDRREFLFPSYRKGFAPVSVEGQFLGRTSKLLSPRFGLFLCMRVA